MPKCISLLVHLFLFMLATTACGNALGDMPERISHKRGMKVACRLTYRTLLTPIVSVDIAEIGCVGAKTHADHDRVR